MYNPYNPYGYLYPGQQMIQQPMFQSPNMGAQQPQSQAANTSPVVLQVSTVKQVEQTQVQPGGKALVLVANEPVIAMRTADNMGVTSTDYYHIERFDPDAATSTQSNNFVTHEELQRAIAGITQQIHRVSCVAENEEEVKK